MTNETTHNIVRTSIRRDRETFHMTAITAYTAPADNRPTPLVTLREIKHNIHLRFNPDEARTLAHILTTEADKADADHAADPKPFNEEAHKWKQRSRMWEARAKGKTKQDDTTDHDTTQEAE